MAFSMEKVATPARACESDAGMPSKKIPKVSELTIEVGHRPPPPRRLSVNADVELRIYKYTEDASAMWEDVTEEGFSLWQVQLRHDAFDSIIVNLYDKFNTFLAAHDDDAVPKHLIQLQKQAFVKLITTNAQDPDLCGTFVRFRTAFYVAGRDESALHNFLLLLDKFWLGRERETDVTVNFRPHFGVDIACVWDRCHHETYNLYDAQALDVSIFEAHPVQGRRILQMSLQVESNDTLSIVLHGSTWFFRDRFDAFGVPGYRREGANGEPSTYYRVLESVNASSQAETDRVIDMLGPTVLKNTAVRVSIDGAMKAGTSVYKFVHILRQRPSLHFV